MNAWYFPPKKSIVIQADNDTEQATLELVEGLLASGEATMDIEIDSAIDHYGFIFRKKTEEEKQ